MNNYHRGRGREGSLKITLWEHGHAAFRMYRSAGGAPLDYQIDPDLIRQKLKKMVMPVDLIDSSEFAGPCYIQASKYFTDISQKEIDELKRLAIIGNVRPILAYQKKSRRKADRKNNGWIFVDASNGSETKLW